MNSHDETPTTKPRVVKGKFSAQKFNHYQCGMKKWTVVWCDEGSLSDEKQSMRDGFIDLAHKHGATFLCLKKAHNFERWSAMTSKPYVLYTSWREAKRCVAAMPGQGSEGRPIFTIIFCVDAVQQEKAERWARRLAERQEPIYIHGESSSVESTLACLLSQVPKALDNDDVQFTELIKDHMQTKLELEKLATMHEPVVPSCEPVKSELGIQDTPEHVHTKRDDVLQQKLSHATKVTPLQTCESQPTGRVSHINQAMVPLHPSVAVYVAHTWAYYSSSADVELALLAAMPDFYEE